MFLKCGDCSFLIFSIVGIRLFLTQSLLQQLIFAQIPADDAKKRLHVEWYALDGHIHWTLGAGFMNPLQLTNPTFEIYEFSYSPFHMMPITRKYEFPEVLVDDIFPGYTIEFGSLFICFYDVQVAVDENKAVACFKVEITEERLVGVKMHGNRLF
ncbi:MAG: hypothetical protein P8Y40_00285 [Desulfobacterales bacterium]